MWGLGKLAAVGVGLFAGGSFLNKLMGGDPDFTQAWMINRMSGQGGFFKTYFEDGLKSMFLGSRTASALYGSGMYGAGLYGNPYLMGRNPYMMNPMLMGGMPYGMGLGSMMWGGGRYF
jgi:hypothetical protein